MKKSHYGIIYKVTNKINNKVYIGQTIKSLSDRRKKHFTCSKDSNYYFHKALRKYDDVVFIWEVIEMCQSKEELDEMEFHYIKQYNSFGSGGYNLTFGGEGFVGKHSKSTKTLLSKKLSNYFKHNENPMKGKNIL